jgi:hypothetical protein
MSKGNSTPGAPETQDDPTRGFVMHLVVRKGRLTCKRCSRPVAVTPHTCKEVRR